MFIVYQAAPFYFWLRFRFTVLVLIVWSDKLLHTTTLYKPVGATHHGRLHNAQATEWREGLDRPGRGHPDLAGIYQPGNMTIDARKKKKKNYIVTITQVGRLLTSFCLQC